MIPHITNEIKSRFYRNYTAKDIQIAIIEVGGTVGDIESQPFLEALRQFQNDVGHENAILIHVTLIPYLKSSGEMKTKPTQASVKELQGMGIKPDIIVCRSEYPIDQGIKDKIALFCNVESDHVLQNLDVEVLYEAPLAMEKEHLAEVVCECLHLECKEPDSKHIPKSGIFFILAYAIAVIIPSIPRSPNPPGTMMPFTPSIISSIFSFFICSESIHFIFTEAPFATLPCFNASTTLI